MFLFIPEDDKVLQGDTCDAGDLAAVDDGLLIIIDISDSEKPLQYYAGEWVEIDKAHLHGESEPSSRR